MNDLSGLYGLSIHSSGEDIPEQAFLADLLIDICDLLRCPRGIVDHVSHLIGLRGLCRHGGVFMDGCCTFVVSMTGRSTNLRQHRIVCRRCNVEIIRGRE